MDSGRGQDGQHDDRGNPPPEGVGGSPPAGSSASGAPRRGRRRLWGFLIGGAILLVLVFLTAGAVAVVLASSAGGGGSAAAPDVFVEEYVSGEGEDKIAVLPVEGVIGSQEPTSPMGTPAATPETLRDALRQAAEDESVKAAVVEVNSPGGGVVASAEMHQAILDFKEESGKPVVVSMGDTAASGGYYIATAADSIVANETTLTGSLGAILSYLNYEDAARRLGLEEEVIKSGEFKDIGSPSREPTEEEREILQRIIDESYDTFVEVIVEGRNLPEDRVRELADGRVYSGLQAEQLGLVDELGDLDGAARVSQRLADVEAATVVRYTSEPGLTELLQARLAQKPESEALEAIEAAGFSPTPQLQYLYRP